MSYLSRRVFPRCIFIITLLLLNPDAHATFINHSTHEIHAKIVYYGGATAGLSENLQYIYAKTAPAAKGKLTALAADSERTLFYDFLPLTLGEIRGFKVRLNLYTVPGKAEYNASRKLLLKGADGVVFVADSDPAHREENIASIASLRSNLAAEGRDWKQLPLVVQLGHRDHPQAMPVEQMKRELGLTTQPTFSVIVLQGVGVFESLKAITKLILTELKKGA